MLKKKEKRKGVTLITEIYYHVDNFCKEYEKYLQKIGITKNESSRRGPKQGLTISEIMTIVIYFHHSKFRTFKDYYLFLQTYYLKAFKRFLSYNRFLEIQKQVVIPLFLFLSIFKKATKISFIDLTCIKVCHNKRIYSNKVFKNIAARGKTSVGWFYGFKLHLTINEYGEIVGFYITPGNFADNNLDVVQKITKNITGKLFGDKGYLSEKLFQILYEKGIYLVTKLRKNMKNKLMNVYDKLLLKSRGVIESVNNILKNKCMLEHTRHRSISNFLLIFWHH